MERVIGILLFQSSYYGEIDFDISKCMEILFEGLALKLDKEKTKESFITESKKYLNEEADNVNLSDFFDCHWNKYVKYETC